MQLGEEKLLAKYAFIRDRLTRFSFIEISISAKNSPSITTVLNNKTIVDVLCFGFQNAVNSLWVNSLNSELKLLLNYLNGIKEFAIIFHLILSSCSIY